MEQIESAETSDTGWLLQFIYHKSYSLLSLVEEAVKVCLYDNSSFHLLNFRMHMGHPAVEFKLCFP